MALVSLPIGFPCPDYQGISGSLNLFTLNAAGRMGAFIGRVYIDGRPSSPKTLSSAGGAIIWRAFAGPTFADAGTSLVIGLQDVSTGAGPPGRPDGVFDVSAELVGGVDPVIGAAANTAVMESGSKSIAHGDLVAVAWHLVSRGATDQVAIQGGIGLQTRAHPNFVTSTDNGATWSGGSNAIPNIVLVFDDGTLGILAGGIPVQHQGADTFQASSNPDEIGIAFQLPFDGAIDAVIAELGITNASSDFTLALYSDPFGTPTLMASVDVVAEHFAQTANERTAVFPFATEQPLARNTDYAIAVIATGTSNVRMRYLTLAAEAHRRFIGGVGESYVRVTRNDGAGPFAAESPALTMPLLAVRISQVPDGAGGGDSAGLHPISEGIIG